MEPARSLHDSVEEWRRAGGRGMPGGGQPPAGHLGHHDQQGYGGGHYDQQGYGGGHHDQGGFGGGHHDQGGYSGGHHDQGGFGGGHHDQGGYSGGHPSQASPRHQQGSPGGRVGASPGPRRTKIKVSGPTQTLGGEAVPGSPGGRRPMAGPLAGPHSPLPGRQLSETTKERLLASGQLQYHHIHAPGSPYSKARTSTRRLSRDRPGPAQLASLTNCEYFTDSDSVYTLEQGRWDPPDHSSEGKRMRAANSLDSLDCVTNSIKQARANSIQPGPEVGEAGLASPWLGGEPGLASPRLIRINRSNSVSTRMVAGAQPDHLQRSLPPKRKASEESEYYGIPLAVGPKTQPPSPCSTLRSGMLHSRSVPRSYKRSESSPSRQADCGQGRDEGHGSLSSLVSLGHLSSASHLGEEKAALEIQRLRRELREEHDRVQRLSSQLSTNAHVVSAFEQSLHNMTSRLQHLTVTADEKDRELQELHGTIESLSRQRISIARGEYDRSQSTESLGSGLGTRGFVSGTSDSENDDQNCPSRRMLNFRKRKSRWLRQSLSKAFSRRRKGSGPAEVEGRRLPLPTCEAATSCPGSPSARGHLRSKSASALDQGEGPALDSLRQQLQAKDGQLTETRLEALSSAHHLHGLRETIARLRVEVSLLREENSRLQQDHVPAGYSPSSTQERPHASPSPRRAPPDRSLERGSSALSSLSATPSLSPARSLAREAATAGSKAATDRKGCSLLQISCSVETDLDEVLVPVSVISAGLPQRPEVKIGHVSISRNSSWIYLDDCLRGLVKTYLTKLDPENQLELTNQSMVCYQCGNIRRVFKGPEPERRPSLLPDTRIWVSFRGGTDRGSIEDLAFTTLIPRPTVKHYIATLAKYQRAVLVGQAGVGKSFLAKKLAEFLVLKSGEELTADSISVFWCNKATVQQCQDHIARVTRPRSSGPGGRPRPGLPAVLLLENIHSQGSKILQILARIEGTSEETPFILCTSLPTEYITDLGETHHFAEIALGQDVDLLQGFLGRALRRKMLNIEVASKLANFDMPDAIQWLLRIYCNLYIFVKTSSGGEAVLSPQQFLTCPTDSTAALRSWFLDLWNSGLVPRLRQVAGRRPEGDRPDWEDPVKFVIRTWPWPDQAEGLPQALLRVKTESRRREAEEQEGADPLLAMLLCLQEATLYKEDPGSQSDVTNRSSDVSAGKGSKSSDSRQQTAEEED